MSRRNNGKIPTDGGEGLAGNPFAGLRSSGLPGGPSKGGKAGGAKGKAPLAPGKRGRVELRREKAGRGGKTVTTLSAFPRHVPLGQLEDLAQDLKKSCACGGSVKGRVIELQGDVRDRVEDALARSGYQPVRAGG
ncbi:MAG: translation initiation factor [Verrucomicrobiota bacterium]